jgi:hypothetical protein
MDRLLIVIVAVAVAGAVRSTWSPCGLSMLSTITPIGERGRGHTFGVTAAWFIGGAVAGGATLGALAAAGAALVGATGLADPARAAIAAGAALVAAASDAQWAGFRLPIHRRQVNELWLDRFRSWVYGLCFGWQIGVGLATYVMTAAVYLLLVLAALSSSPAVALLAGVVFGLGRGLAVLLGRSITSPERLRAFHRRFEAAGPRVRRAVIAVMVIGAVAEAAAVSTGAAVAAAELGAVIMAVGWRGRRHQERTAVRGDPAPAAPAPAARRGNVVVEGTPAA